MPMHIISSGFAYIDVKIGRAALAKLVEKAVRIPVTIEGDIVKQSSGDDGVSREFEVEVSGVKLGAPKHPQAVIPVGDVHEGSILIADDGFSCLSEGQHCIVKTDRKGDLCVRCRRGSHGLDGQLDRRGKNYVGFYLKGAPHRYS